MHNSMQFILTSITYCNIPENSWVIFFFKHTRFTIHNNMVPVQIIDADRCSAFTRDLQYISIWQYIDTLIEYRIVILCSIISIETSKCLVVHVLCC